MAVNDDRTRNNSSDKLLLANCIFHLNRRELLTQSGKTVPLRIQSLKVLLTLAEKLGETISKDEIIRTVWAESYVTDDSLVQCISEIRKSIGDTEHSIIQTFAKQGYRLNAERIHTSDTKASTFEKNTKNSHNGKTSTSKLALIPIPTLSTQTVLSVLGIALFSLGMHWTLLRNGDTEIRTSPVIAIMALNDVSNGDEKGYLSNAISQGIATEISRFNEFEVISPESSLQYSGSVADSLTIAKELNAHYILEGSQQKDGDRLRITVRLVDARSGKHLWARAYDRRLAEVFIVQSEIARTIASEVGVTVAFMPPPKGGTRRFSALRYHLEARPYLDKVTREGLEIAQDLNQKAIDVDPESAHGYVGMAYVYWQKHRTGWLDESTESTLKKGISYADKALLLDSNNYSAYVVRARLYIQAGELDQAIAHMESSLKLNPSAVHVMVDLAIPLVYKEQYSRALKLIDKAFRLHPNHLNWWFGAQAWAYWESGDCVNAKKSWQRMLHTPLPFYVVKAVIHICSGEQSLAQATITELLSKRPGYSIAKESEQMAVKYSTPDQLARWLKTLQKAGLPEN